MAVTLFLAGLAAAAPLPSQPAPEPSHSALAGTWRGTWDGTPFRGTFFPNGRWRCALDPDDGRAWEGAWWVARGELWIREYEVLQAGPGPLFTYHFTGTLGRLQAVPGCQDETPLPTTVILQKRKRK